MESKMKILITGGAGYIGSTLCNYLIPEDHKITILDTLPEGTIYLNNFLSSDNLFVIKDDIRNEKVITKLIRENDVIYHLAGLVGTPICNQNPYDTQSVNIDATKYICKKVSKNQKFIFASTSVVYGKVNGKCDENTPLNATTSYAISKIEGEKYSTDIGGINLRLATLCGVSHKMRDDLLIHTLSRDAVQNGCITMFQSHSQRTFLDVNDASLCLSLAKNDTFQQGEAYNVGDDNYNYTKMEIAQMIVKETNAKILEGDFSTDLDKRDHETSYDKLTATGYKSLVPFNKTMKNVINYYKLNV